MTDTNITKKLILYLFLLSFGEKYDLKFWIAIYLNHPEQDFLEPIIVIRDRRSLPIYQGILPSSLKKPPLAPSWARVANWIIMRTPSSTVLGAASEPRSVFTHPGQTELTLIAVSDSCLANLNG